MKIIPFLLMISFIVGGCCSVNKKNEADNSVKGTKTPGPSLYIYKTKADYYNNVPVIMNDDKTEIISYPHPSDLVVSGSLLLPTKLENGYLLDNKGINKNVVFLKIKYTEYSKLQDVPTLDELKNLIIDKNPFLELYDCGLRSNYKEPETELNSIIKQRKIDKFKRII
ncbi:MAG: hypothetical protein WCT77_04925 [Bacteroidota bacterium]